MIATIKNGIAHFKLSEWRERFRYSLPREFLHKDYQQGSQLPPFYLPVYSRLDTNTIVLWILPLAPFVLLWHILVDASWIIWKDLVYVAVLMKEVADHYRSKV
jgi:hypothetical protein